MRGRAIPAVLALLLVAGCSPPPSRVVPAVPGLPPPPPQDLSGVVLPPGIAVVEGRIYCEKDGAEMVLVPAGEFLMGEDVETCSGDWRRVDEGCRRLRRQSKATSRGR